MIYLDYGATTPMDPTVLESIKPFLESEFGNPNGKYYALAIEAKKAVEQARQNVSLLLGCQENEIIFTSGATEGNNFVIKGVADLKREQGRHIITTRIEHSSVLETCRYLERNGWEITYLDVTQDGRVSVEDITSHLKPETVLVSIVWGNSEIGTLQDISSIGQAIRKYSHNVLFHSDATQVVGKIPIDLKTMAIDFLTFSGHKFYGPKGIGGVAIKRNKNGIYPRLTPLLHGGEQEMGLRAGTLAVPNIVGMGKAAEIALTSMKEQDDHVKFLVQILVSSLNKSGIDYRINGSLDFRLPGIISVTLFRVNNEIMIKALANELAISTGSACSSAKPSYVLEAIGLTKEDTRNTIRLSFGKFTQAQDIIRAIELINKVYRKFKTIN